MARDSLARTTLFVLVTACPVACTHRHAMVAIRTEWPATGATTLPGMALPAVCPAADARATDAGPCSRPFSHPGTPVDDRATGPRGVLPLAREPSLLEFATRDAEVYRFLLLPTWDSPVVVRVEHSPSGQFLVAKETRGGGYPTSWTGFRSMSRALTPTEWSDVVRSVEASGFWSAPTEGCEADEAACRYFDGSGFLLEGLRAGVHHVVERDSPRHGRFYQACLTILRLAGRDIESSD